MNSIGGQTFAKGLLEWNLPPLRFENVGWPSFYITWARASLFTTGLLTSPDDSDLRSEYANVGAQIDVRFTALSKLNMTISLGLARAFLAGGASSNEFMLSLKIL